MVNVAVFHRYARQNVVALGKFALNLIGFPREQTGSEIVYHFSRLLSSLVTKVCTYILCCSNSNSCDNVYGAHIVAVNCHCKSSPGSFGQSSTSARQLSTFGPDRSI